MKKQILIDKFFVPKNSAEEFIQRMNYNRNLIKNLPGFMKDEAFMQTHEDGSLTVITVATWENEVRIAFAKEAVQKEYERIGFSPVEFYKRLQIKMERGLFNELADGVNS